MPCNFFNTTACCAAVTSALLVAFPTLILAKHPAVSTTVVSVGSLVDPHVLTSGAVPLDALLILDKTNLKSAGDEHVLPLTAGKLTLSQMSDGR